MPFAQSRSLAVLEILHTITFVDDLEQPIDRNIPRPQRPALLRSNWRLSTWKQLRGLRVTGSDTHLRSGQRVTHRLGAF